jgi:alginate O-acetyltransferase complex protein AlgI
MLFTSSAFWFLLVVTFVLYYLRFFQKYQKIILIAASLIFYSYDNLSLVLLLVLSVGINITSSYFVTYGRIDRQKSWAILGIAANLLILIFFKYGSLVAHTLMNVNSDFGHLLISLPLPIGISFFTFQGISLVVDVYSEKYSNKRDVVPMNFLQHCERVFLFKAFFPQLISGPIVKAHDFIPQITIKYFKNVDWSKVLKTLILGYFLKMVIADNLKDFTFWIAFPYFQSQGSITLIALLFGYSFQIFADFAGYSLIAIGLAKLFGYNFPINFNFPYISTSFKEFWKRWHISLSSFLMEYLYFPLGGNKKGKLRTYLNLMAVMVIGGLWHGAAWSYAVWGAFHGLLLVVERLLNIELKLITNNRFRWFWSFLKILGVFTMITVGWLLFKLPDFSQVLDFLRCIIVNTNSWNDINKISGVFIYSLPIVAYHIIYLLQKSDFAFCKTKFYSRSMDVLYGAMLFLIISNHGSSGSFIYFQF